MKVVVRLSGGPRTRAPADLFLPASRRACGQARAPATSCGSILSSGLRGARGWLLQQGVRHQLHLVIRRADVRQGFAHPSRSLSSAASAGSSRAMPNAIAGSAERPVGDPTLPRGSGRGRRSGRLETAGAVDELLHQPGPPDAGGAARDPVRTCLAAAASPSRHQRVDLRSRADDPAVSPTALACLRSPPPAPAPVPSTVPSFPLSVTRSGPRSGMRASSPRTFADRRGRPGLAAWSRRAATFTASPATIAWLTSSLVGAITPPVFTRRVPAALRRSGARSRDSAPPAVAGSRGPRARPAPHRPRVPQGRRTPREPVTGTSRRCRPTSRCMPRWRRSTAQHGPQAFGIEPASELGRAGQVGEQHRGQLRSSLRSIPPTGAAHTRLQPRTLRVLLPRTACRSSRSEGISSVAPPVARSQQAGRHPSRA